MIYWIIHYLVRIILPRSTKATSGALRPPYVRRRSGGNASSPIAGIVVNLLKREHRANRFAPVWRKESRRLKVSVNTMQIWATFFERGDVRR